MHTKHVFCIFIFVVALVGPVLAVHAADPTQPATGSASAPGSGGLDPATRANLKPMQLSEAQVKGFFDASDEFAALGHAIGKRSQPGGAPLPDDLARGAGSADATMEILRKHGFEDPREFQRVAYNVALAFGVLEKGGTKAARAEFEQAKAEREKALAQLRERMPAEQVQMLEKQLKQMEEMAAMMQNVPDANVELMRKYRGRMEKLHQK